MEDSQSRMKKVKSISIILIAFALIVLGDMLIADRGMIPIIPNVSVYEPGQKAILAWNGKKEILILSTDIFSDDKTKVLEIIPLPSEPSVQKGDFESFEYIDSLVRTHRPPFPHSREDMKMGVEGEGVEVLFFKEIGAHSITCVKATDWDEFTMWSEDYLEKEEIGDITFPEEFTPIIEKYIRNGFTYFIFDITEIDEEKRSVEPIVYSFESQYLYYPLEISSIIKGETDITLYIITKQEMDLTDTHTGLRQGVYYEYGYEGYPLELHDIKGAKEGTEKTGAEIQFSITPHQQKKIHKDIDLLFLGDVFLTTLRYSGGTDGLRNDLLIKE
jgi:hypothetical protein